MVLTGIHGLPELVREFQNSVDPGPVRNLIFFLRPVPVPGFHFFVSGPFRDFNLLSVLFGFRTDRFWLVDRLVLVTSLFWRLEIDDNFWMSLTKFWDCWHLWDAGVFKEIVNAGDKNGQPCYQQTLSPKFVTSIDVALVLYQFHFSWLKIEHYWDRNDSSRSYLQSFMYNT